MSKSTNLFYFKPKLGFPEWETRLPVEWMMKNEGKKCWAELGRETGVRTNPQNNSVHLYCKLLGDALNDAGFPHKFQLGNKLIELDWNTKLVKENIWRPIQVEILGKKSTTELSKTEDIDLVYEHLNRFFSNEPFFIHVPFPSEANRNK